MLGSSKVTALRHWIELRVRVTRKRLWKHLKSELYALLKLILHRDSSKLSKSSSPKVLIYLDCEAI